MTRTLHLVEAVSCALTSGASGLPASIGGNVPPLPKPPALESLVFESPTLLIVALGAVALAAFFGFRAQGQTSRGSLIAGMAIVLSGALLLVSRLVTTPREHMQQRTRELVRAVAEVNIPALNGLLAPDARLIADRFRVVAGMDGADREQIIAGVEERIGGRYRVEDWAVLKLQATQDGPAVGRTQTQVRVNAGGLNFSWWKIDWRLQEDGQWRVVGIEPLFISGVGG